MKKYIIFLLLTALSITASNVKAEKTITLSSIDWPPYTGEKLKNEGFFSELVTEIFTRVGYRVKYEYSSWPRALHRAQTGEVDGVMNCYWKKERTTHLKYPDVAWQVKEEFITLKSRNISYTGNINEFQKLTIGTLRDSLQSQQLVSAGLAVSAINDQSQNVKKLMAGRVDAVLMPQSVFFYYLTRLFPKFDPLKIKVLTPPYKVFDMYVAFSKKKKGYARTAVDFNRGLQMIRNDGTYHRIVNKHFVKELGSIFILK